MSQGIWLQVAPHGERRACVRRSKKVEPERRYYVELVKGQVDLEGLDRKSETSRHSDRQVEHQRDVRAALDLSAQRGWRLINVTSPTSFQALQQGNAFGAVAPTLLFWDTEA